MTHFSREVSDIGGDHLVTLTGELDLDSVGDVAEWLSAIAGSSVVVDLSRPTIMDSSGITAIIGAKTTMEGEGDEFMLKDPHPTVRQVLEITGLGDRIDDDGDTYTTPAASTLSGSRSRIGRTGADPDPG